MRTHWPIRTKSFFTAETSLATSSWLVSDFPPEWFSGGAALTVQGRIRLGPAPNLAAPSYWTSTCTVSAITSIEGKVMQKKWH